MTGLWVRLVKKHRINRQTTRECAFSGARDALTEICRELDVPRPIWLPKHEREFDSFRMTAFQRDHFLEDVPFDRLEIEFIDGEKRKSRDPRNDFGF